MYDSVNAASIPADAEIVAGYIDGRYAWTAADWNRFPKARKVTIAVFPSTNNGEALDCEAGDATPAQCPAWVRKRQAAGLAIPTIYCSRSAWPAVQAACKGLTVDYWIAEYSGIPHIPDGAAACQWTSGPGYDTSLTAPWWPR